MLVVALLLLTVGSAGDIVDMKFAGPFHPVFGDIEKLLNRQIDDDIISNANNVDKNIILFIV